MPNHFASRTNSLACDGCGQGSRDDHGAATWRATLSPEEPSELRMTLQVTELEWWPAATGCCCWERALEGDVRPHRSPRCPLPAGRCHLSQPELRLTHLIPCWVYSGVKRPSPKPSLCCTCRETPAELGGSVLLGDVWAQRRDSSSSPSLLISHHSAGPGGFPAAWLQDEGTKSCLGGTTRRSHIRVCTSTDE